MNRNGCPTTVGIRTGYPERYAQMALGHTSKAVHRAYAKKAQVTLPPLEEYENKSEQKVIAIEFGNRNVV